MKSIQYLKTLSRLGFKSVHNPISIYLTHWGQVTHICVSKLTVIGLDNGLSPGRHQAIIRTNARMLLTEPSGTKFSDIFIEIHTFSFKKMLREISSSKQQPSHPGISVLTHWGLDKNGGRLGDYILNSFSHRELQYFSSQLHRSLLLWIQINKSLLVQAIVRAPSQYKDRLIYVWRFPC